MAIYAQQCLVRIAGFTGKIENNCQEQSVKWMIIIGRKKVEKSC